jgi:hypothetical protein
MLREKRVDKNSLVASSFTRNAVAALVLKETLVTVTRYEINTKRSLQSSC